MDPRSPVGRALESDHIKVMAQRGLIKRLSPTADTVALSPPKAPVIILGSGLSALSLAFKLRTMDIPFEIYTKDRKPQ